MNAWLRVAVGLGERALLVEAALLLSLARLAVLALPFRWLVRGLGRRDIETETALSREDARAARRIRWAVEAAAGRLPWNASCLPQAIAGRIMLRLRGIRGTVLLGLKNGESRELLAHAWLRAGGLVVTGGAGDREFTRIARFG